MSRKASPVIAIIVLSFIFVVLISGCTASTLVEKDIFIDSVAVVKEVPFGTELSLEGLIVKVQMTNGNFVTLARGGEGYEVDDDDYEKDTPGTYTITISYKDFAAESFNITILEEVIIDENENTDIVQTGIAIDDNAGKRLFVFGEEFSTEGIIVRKVFSDDTTQVLTEQQYLVTSDSYKADEAGSYVITIQYTDGQKTFSDTYTVTVTPETETILTKITLKTHETKTEYLFGEDFSPAGLIVEKWYLSDNVLFTELAAQSEYTVDAANYDKNDLGNHEIIITMKETNVSKSYMVEVNDYLASITANQTIRIFDLGQAFDSDGFTVTEYMASGAYSLAEPVNYTIDSSDYDAETEDTYTIRVYMTANPSMYTTFDVEVMDIPDL